MPGVALKLQPLPGPASQADITRAPSLNILAPDKAMAVRDEQCDENLRIAATARQDSRVLTEAAVLCIGDACNKQRQVWAEYKKTTFVNPFSVATPAELGTMRAPDPTKGNLAVCCASYGMSKGLESATITIIDVVGRPFVKAVAKKTFPAYVDANEPRSPTGQAGDSFIGEDPKKFNGWSLCAAA